MGIPNWSEITQLVSDAVTNNQFFQGGAVLGILVALGNSLRNVPLIIWNRIERLLIYKVNVEEIDELFYYFEVWLADNHFSKYRNVEASIKLRKTTNENHVNESENEGVLEEKIFYKQFDDVFYVRRGLSYIRIAKHREKLENASSLTNAFYNKFNLSGFSKKAVNALIEEVLEYNKNKKLTELSNSIDVKSCNQWGDWVKESVMEPKSMDKIYLEGKDYLLNDIHNFLNSESFYKMNNIIYKRGYLFTGPPGNGKSSFIMSLARSLNKSVNFLNLNNISDSNIREAFRNLKSNSLLVIEDVDAAFGDRVSNKDIRFSFSTLLNCLDGVFSKEDIIVIFTSNYPERLDEALIREGRVDLKFEFKNPNKDMIELYLKDQFAEFDEMDFDYLFGDYEPKLPMVNIQGIILKSRGKSLRDIMGEIITENESFIPKLPKLPKEVRTKKSKLNG